MILMFQLFKENPDDLWIDSNMISNIHIYILSINKNK